MAKNLMYLFQGDMRQEKSWIPILVVVLGTIIAIGAFVITKIGTTVNAYNLIHEFADSPDYSMTLSIDSKLNNQLTHADIEVTKTQVDGHTVTSVQKSGISLYYAGGGMQPNFAE